MNTIDMAGVDRLASWGTEVERASVRGFDALVYSSRRRRVAEMLADARRWPERIHLVDGEERLTFAEHEHRVVAASQVLREHQVGPGDRVMLFCSNRIELGILFWAVHLIGGVVVMGNSWWRSEQFERACEEVRPRLVVADETTRPHVGDRWSVLKVDQIADRIRARDVTTVALPDVAEDDEAVVLFTAGSTGAPKAVSLAQRSVIHNMQNLLTTSRRAPSQIPNDHPGSTALLSVPLFHLAGMQVLVSTLLTGGKIVFQTGRFDAGEVLRLVEEERVNTWGAVPAMVVRVMDDPTFEQRDVSSLRSIGLGGAATPAELQQRIAHAFDGLSGSGTGSLYGLTENGGLIAMGKAKDLEGVPGAVGRLVAGTEVEVRDEDVSGEGEVFVRSAGQMLGYLGDVDDGIDNAGWLRTGDRGRLEGDVLCITGRSKEIIIRGGENIACARVEEALLRHPDVTEAAALPLEHPELGEEVGAVVVCRAGTSVNEQKLRQFAKEQLSHYEVPTRWWLRDDHLPLSPQGKVERQTLRREWLSRPDIEACAIPARRG